jgi:hypothetical protein
MTPAEHARGPQVVARRNVFGGLHRVGFFDEAHRGAAATDAFTRFDVAEACVRARRHDPERDQLVLLRQFDRA